MHLYVAKLSRNQLRQKRLDRQLNEWMNERTNERMNERMNRHLYLSPGSESAITDFSTPIQ